MPIKPENMHKYPGGSIRSPEWLAIRKRIQKRAGDACERCGVENGRLVVRSLCGLFWRYLTGDWDTIHQADPNEDHIEDLKTAHWRSKHIKIVCTTAHIDNDLKDHSDDNLAFWCQRCHNKHDAKGRAVNAAKTKREKSGKLSLFDWKGPNKH